MTSLRDLEAEAARLNQQVERARTELREARSSVQDKIREHARVHIRVLGGAGTRADLDQAAAARDAAIARLEQVERNIMGA